ncbi:MAG: AMP-binding protein, partial [Holophagales bacterium]|nr:AMP-binding protein [Holophagales bacterium]
MKELIFHRLFVPAMNYLANKESIIDGAYSATFGEHADRTMRLCTALSGELGVGRSDRFAVMALTSHEYVELYHAAYLGAGVINPLNLRLAGKELDYIVRDSGTEVAFVDKTFAPLFAQAMALAGDECTVRRTVLIGGPDDETNAPYDLRYEDLIAGSDPVLPDEPEETDPVVLMYTGGTTGLPKGVLCNQRAEILNTYHGIMRFPQLSDGVALLQTPIFHAASMVGVIATQTFGGKFVLMPMFDPGAAIALIEKYQVTTTTMVPTMIHMMMSHPDFTPEKLASLRNLGYGASPMPAALLDRLLSLFPEMEIGQGYGMTESSSLLTVLDAEDHKVGGDRLRSVGRAVPGVVLSIQDEDGNILPSGEIGEVCAKGGNYMTEYWNKPEATEEAFQGGWYHTGDAGYLDEEGYLFLVDRVKDMIVSGGENVYSAEVESAISTHPVVGQVAVIGIPHEVWGEQVHAIVVPKEGADVDEGT